MILVDCESFVVEWLRVYRILMILSSFLNFLLVILFEIERILAPARHCLIFAYLKFSLIVNEVSLLFVVALLFALQLRGRMAVMDIREDAIEYQFVLAGFEDFFGLLVDENWLLLVVDHHNPVLQEFENRFVNWKFLVQLYP